MLICPYLENAWTYEQSVKWFHTLMGPALDCRYAYFEKMNWYPDFWIFQICHFFNYFAYISRSARRVHKGMAGLQPVTYPTSLRL